MPGTLHFALAMREKEKCQRQRSALTLHESDWHATRNLELHTHLQSGNILRSMSVTALTKWIRTQLDPIIGESGSLIFISVATLTRGDLYLLGLNPQALKGCPTRTDALAMMPTFITSA